MNKVFIIAELGINHNGDIDIAKRLIWAAKESGADMVKLQKRTLDRVYTQEELDKPRESPWGSTNRQQKAGLEFGTEQYDQIDALCHEVGIEWFVSPWDLESVAFMNEYRNVKYNKVASALLTHVDLLKAIAEQGKYTFISTGMSTLDEIARAVMIFDNYKCPYELMHCNSQYPQPIDQTNLKCIKLLRHKFDCNVGYSCHSAGILPPALAVMFGATSIEKHITLDRTMYGSDQAASVEPTGFAKMVEYIRCAEQCIGDGDKIIWPGEEPIRKKLARNKDY